MDIKEHNNGGNGHNGISHLIKIHYFGIIHGDLYKLRINFGMIVQWNKLSFQVK